MSLLLGVKKVLLAPAVVSAPPSAGIGTPFTLGAAVQASSIGTTMAIPSTEAEAPLDSLIVVASHGGSDNELDTLDDPTSRTYTHQSFLTNGVRRTRWSYSQAGDAVAAASVITGDFGNVNGVKHLVAGCVTGIETTGGPIENSGSVLASTTTPSHTTASLAAGSKVLFAYIFTLLSNADGFTEDAANGWTTLDDVEQGGASAGAMRVAYKVTSAAGTQTYAPTLPISRACTIDIIAFEAA